MSKFQRGHRRASKVTAEDVMQILHAYQNGVTQGELAREFGLTIGSIGRIVRGETHQAVTRGQVKSTEEIRDDAAQSAGRLLKLMELEGLEPTVVSPPDAGGGGAKDPLCTCEGEHDSRTAPDCPASRSNELFNRLTADIAKAKGLNDQLEELKK